MQSELQQNEHAVEANENEPLLADESSNQQDDLGAKSKASKRYICGLAVKKNITVWNVMAMPWMVIIGVSEMSY